MDRLHSFWNLSTARLTKLRSLALAHKGWSAVAIVVVLGGGYYAYHANASASITSYTVAQASQGPIQVTVTGSGQVSSEHELTLSPKASGEVTGVYVTPGEYVRAGTLVATLDMTDAASAVRSAEQNLKSAQISYQQSLSSNQNSTASDQSSLQGSTITLSSALASTYAGLPSIMTGFDTVLHGMSTLNGYLAFQNIDAYRQYVNTAESQQDYLQTSQAYAAAVTAYQQAQSAYAGYDLNSATPQQAVQMAQTTVAATQAITAALRDALTFYMYINSQATVGARAAPPSLTSQISSLTSYLSTATGYTNTLTSAKNSLSSTAQSVQSDTQSYAGTTLSLASAELNVEKAQESLTEAQNAEADYVVRAPFAGTIASVAVKKFDQASGASPVAVLITPQDYVDLSLNEADAAKVATGQPVALTFDALPNLTATGTIAEIDQVGTVSQGVTTFNVKVALSVSDEQIKPGMTAQATITTASKASALLVPSSAVHTANGRSYVEVATVVGTSTPFSNAGRPGTSATSTARARFGSGTSTLSARTGAIPAGTAGAAAFAGRTFTRTETLPAANVTIRQVPVTLGLSSDTMTEIASGLTAGQIIVTGTATGGTKTTAAATTRTGATTGFGALGGAAGGSAATAARRTTGTAGAGGAVRIGG